MRKPLILLSAGLLWACSSKEPPVEAVAAPAAAAPAGPVAPPLPAPDTSHQVVKLSKTVGWTKGKSPVVPEGFEIKALAQGLDNPRWIYLLPNGDVLVAESNTIRKGSKSKGAGGKSTESANRITLLRDADGDGRPELKTTFAKGLNQPLGMLLLNDKFYVANTDGVLVFPYKLGDTALKGKGKKILDLPVGGYNNHWTRNLIASSDWSKIYVSVGSASNVAEHGIAEENRRANILEINPDGSGERIFGAGLRNPVGMAIEPESKTLWTVVNERDNLGDDLVPDYLTQVDAGGFYGWPFAYFGPNEDPRRAGERPDLVKDTRVPDLALGSHTASLGLTFYGAQVFPDKYRGGAFISQRGSWNRSSFSGYKVIYVPFKNGKPSGPAEDFVTGFFKDEAKGEVQGRPVGLAVNAKGHLLIADDAGNTVWLVKPKAL